MYKIIDDDFDMMWNTLKNSRIRGIPYTIIKKNDRTDIRIELPGVGRELIDVEVKGEYLTVAVKGHESSAAREQRFILNSNTDPSQVSAEYKDGLLVVAVNHRDHPKPAKITID